MNRKKVLIIGASILQLPAINKAKELGYLVGVVDINPKAVGVPLADCFFCISTIDIDGIVATAKDFCPDGIITLATDMPVRAVAKACEECGLPGISYDTAVKATDKAEMIKAFEEHGVDHPKYKVIYSKDDLTHINELMAFPCIMKPTDNAGSRGVVLCHDWAELVSGYEYSIKESRGGTVIVEEYLTGDEFSVEIIVVGGIPHVLQVTDKITTGSPHFVEMGHTQPTLHSSDDRKRIEDLACRAVTALGINSGPAHVEIILTCKGPIMVELGARLGGDCIASHLVPLSTGIDMVEATIKLACGEVVDLTSKIEKGSAIRYFESPSGRIKDIQGEDKARSFEGIQEIYFAHGEGEEYNGIESSSDRIGFVIAQGNNALEAVQRCEEAKKAIRIVME